MTRLHKGQKGVGTAALVQVAKENSGGTRIKEKPLDTVSPAVLALSRLPSSEWLGEQGIASLELPYNLHQASPAKKSEEQPSDVCTKWVRTSSKAGSGRKLCAHVVRVEPGCYHSGLWMAVLLFQTTSLCCFLSFLFFF